MECTNCHQQVPEYANVCGYCGHRLKAQPPAINEEPLEKFETKPQESVQVSAAPEKKPETSPRKHKRRGLVWGIIGAVVLVGVLGFAAIAFLPGLLRPEYVNSPYSNPASGNDDQMQAAPPEVPLSENDIQSQSAPPETSSSSQSESQSNSGDGEFTIPAPVYDYVSNPQIATIEDFTTLDEWEYVGECENCQPGWAMIDGSNDYGAYLSLVSRDIWFNQAVLIKFASLDNLDCEIFLTDTAGEWMTSSYRRVGLAISEGNVLTNFWHGTNPLNTGSDESGPISIIDDHWYYALIATDESDEAMAIVWDESDESVRSRLLSYSGDINDRVWQLIFQVGKGTLVVDSVMILETYGIK